MPNWQALLKLVVRSLKRYIAIPVLQQASRLFHARHAPRQPQSRSTGTPRRARSQRAGWRMVDNECAI